MSSTKAKAQGQWKPIFVRLGVDAALLDGKHRACPSCGGSDRFRFDDVDGTGSHICSQCGAGDGFDLVRKMHGLPDFKESAALIDDAMGWKGEALTNEQKQAYKEKTAALNASTKEAGHVKQTKAAADCVKLWNSAKEAKTNHAYLVAKHIKAYGIRQQGDNLIVPIRIDGEISSVQYINSKKVFGEVGKKRNKNNHLGGRVDGGYHSIAGDETARTSRIVIVEGYGTGASVRAFAGEHVAVAFTASNLGKVAKAIRAKLPDAEIIIAADNDQKKEHNTGYVAATAAALAVGGVVTLPEGKQGLNMDWNDHHQQHGNAKAKADFFAGIEQPKLERIENDTTPENKAVQGEASSGVKVGKPTNNHKNIVDDKEANPLVEAIERLAGLSPLEYDQVRTSEAEALGVRAVTLDAEVKKVRKDIAGNETIFPDVEPWGEEVDGEHLLNDMVGIFKRYAVLPNHAPEVAALWILNTYVHDAGYNSPMIMITSPEKRCGKTTTLNLFQALVNKPLAAGNISPAVVYRAIEKWQPTLLIDEADTFLKNNEEVAGVINSGHTKPSAFVLRCDGDNNEPKRFSTWCPKVIAGIGSQRDTLEDRSIIFPLRRKLPSEKVERLRLDLGSFDELCSKCARWAEDNFHHCKYSSPEPIQGLDDRANDNWLPLLAIAELCKWGERARNAAVLILGEVEQTESIDTILLKDIKAIFAQQQTDRIASQNICNLLAAIDDRPWGEWSKGRPITTNRLASRLKSFSIHSKVMRFKNGDNLKGYELGAFSDAFGRYCTSNRHNVTTQQKQHVTSFQNVTSDNVVTLQTTPKPLQNKGCDVVTVQTSLSGKSKGEADRSDNFLPFGNDDIEVF